MDPLGRLVRASSRVAGLATRRPRRWLIALAALGATAAWLGSTLEYHHDQADFLPRGELAGVPAVVEEVLTRADPVVVVLEADRPIDPDAARAVFRALAGELSTLPSVSSVRYSLDSAERRHLDVVRRNAVRLLDASAIDSLRARLSVGGIEAALAGDPPGMRGPFPPTDPLGIAALFAERAAKIGVPGVELDEGMFALAGRRGYLLTLALDDGGDVRRGLDAVRAIERRVDRLEADHPIARELDARLRVAGGPVVRAELFSLVSRDVPRVVALASLAVLATLWLLFGLRATVALLSPIALGTSMLLAGTALVAGSLNAIAWIFLGVVVGLGVDFGIHVVTHASWGGSDRSPRAAAVRAIEIAGPGILLGACTTAIAMFSLEVVSFPITRQIARVSGAGVLAVLVATVVTLPAVLVAGRRTIRRRRWPQHLAVLLSRGGPAAFLAWAVVVAAGVAAVLTLPVDTGAQGLGPQETDAVATLRRLERRAGASLTPVAVVSRGRDALDAVETDRAVVAALLERADELGVARVQTIAAWLPRDPDANGLPSFEQSVEAVEAQLARSGSPNAYVTDAYLPRLAAVLRPDRARYTPDRLRAAGLSRLVDEHLVDGPEASYAVSRVYLTESPTDAHAVDRLLAGASSGGVLAEARLAGAAYRSARAARVIPGDTARAAALAFALVGALLALGLGHVGAAGLCLLPLLCGLSASAIAMALLNTPVTALSLAVAPLVVGIGVDDGVHLVTRLRRGDDPGEAVRQSGSAMVATTLTTLAALACLGLSRFPGLGEVGFVAALGVAACLVASLQLVPTLGARLAPPRRGEQ